MKRRQAKVRFALALAGLMGVGSAHTASACPNCKEAVSMSEGQVANVASGYNWSVLFMLSVPFSLVGTGALMIRRAVKRGAFPEL